MVVVGDAVEGLLGVPVGYLVQHFLLECLDEVLDDEALEAQIRHRLQVFLTDGPHS